MLTEMRWQKERELMHNVFPQFNPYARWLDRGGEEHASPASAWELTDASGASVFGFEGCLKGRKSGRVYRVVLEAHPQTYPQYPPYVFLDPAVGSCWIHVSSRRALCVTRDWRPARSTFANTLLVVIKYLEEHDGEPDAV